MADIRCGCDSCVFNDMGDCEAENVEIDEELTAAGFLPLCQTYREEEEE